MNDMSYMLAVPIVGDEALVTVAEGVVISLVQICHAVIQAGVSNVVFQAGSAVRR